MSFSWQGDYINTAGDLRLVRGPEPILVHDSLKFQPHLQDMAAFTELLGDDDPDGESPGHARATHQAKRQCRRRAVLCPTASSDAVILPESSNGDQWRS